jgi:peptidoglycan/xylan/chitin deacetylase (PgdA/CDA1 family)
MYHSVGVPPKGAKMRSLYVTPRMFAFQMWYLNFAGFKVVPLSGIVDFVKGNSTTQKIVAITFDDGYRDFYDNAWPVLKAYGYPSAVFLVSGLIGKENSWDKDELGIEKELLGKNDIGELKEAGVTFGSHTRSHPFLTKLSGEELAGEIGSSRCDLEKDMALPVDFFCYPYGDMNEKVRNAVREAGYLAAFTTGRGFVHEGDDLFALRRVPVRLNTHPLSFICKLHSDYETKKGAAE